MALQGIDKVDALSKLFGSISRARILAFFFLNKDKAYYQREIKVQTVLSLQAVQRELNNLVELGILRKKETPVRVYYQINGNSHYFKPLKEIYKPIIQSP